NLNQALDAFNAGLEIGTTLAQADPGNAGWQRDLSVSYERIGDVYGAQGNLNQALDAFNAGLDIRETLAKVDPGNAEWQADLAASYGKLGQLRVAMGDPELARDLFLAGRDIVEPLAAASGHALWQRYLEIFNRELNDLSGQSGDGSS
ncbi:MAG: tetratricopeptide repeat protein, partial [Pseudomonadota bacterium]